eukprot:1727877-Rhodomonas_salina.1
METMREGMMARPRDMKLRSQSGIDISMKPDITNCPAYVPAPDTPQPRQPGATHTAPEYTAR